MELISETEKKEVYLRKGKSSSCCLLLVRWRKRKRRFPSSLFGDVDFEENATTGCSLFRWLWWCRIFIVCDFLIGHEFSLYSIGSNLDCRRVVNFGPNLFRGLRKLFGLVRSSLAFQEFFSSMGFNWFLGSRQVSTRLLNLKRAQLVLMEKTKTLNQFCKYYLGKVL